MGRFETLRERLQNNAGSESPPEPIFRGCPEGNGHFSGTFPDMNGKRVKAKSCARTCNIITVNCEIGELFESPREIPAATRRSPKDHTHVPDPPHHSSVLLQFPPPPLTFMIIVIIIIIITIVISTFIILREEPIEVQKHSATCGRIFAL